MSYFPMFVELENRPCLIVGGGRVAFRKALVLLDFGAVVTAMAPDISDELRALNGVKLLCAEFSPDMLGDYDLVVAASDDLRLNKTISELCRKQKIPINVVDRQEECSFIFPSYIKEKGVVAAFSSGGKSPLLTQYLRDNSKQLVTSLVGDIAECLGRIREEVKLSIETEERRKIIYGEILELALSEGAVPKDDVIERIIEINRLQNGCK